MREKTKTCSVYLMFGNCAVLAVLLLVVGCELSLPKTQGQAARETLSQSRARMLELETAFSNTMASLKVVLALQMLIDDEKSISHYNQEYLKTNTFSIAQYNALDIAPLLGTYTENAQGSYDFNAGLQRIVVHKLSGITIEVFDFVYDNDNRVAQYSLTVTPAGATPQTDKVTISLILYRLNALDWFHHGPSSGIRIEGSVTIPSATPTPYQFDIVQSIGMLGGQNLVSEPFVRSGKRLVIIDRTEGLASTKTFKEEKVLSHEPSDTAGVWVADFVYDHFSGMGMNYDVHLLLDSPKVAISGLANYQTQVQVTSRGMRAASARGGVYGCLVAEPLALGAGDPITIQWVDGVSQALFPSNEHTCEKLIVNVP